MPPTTARKPIIDAIVEYAPSAKLVEIFRDPVHVLVVEDDDSVRETVDAMLNSPLFRKTMVSSVEDALIALPKHRGKLNCWIVDMGFSRFDEGLGLLRRYPNGPPVLVYSGQASMELSDRARDAGATRVFDKDPVSIEPLRETTCVLSALGCLARNRGSAVFPHFLALTKHEVASVEEWGTALGASRKSLERSCQIEGCPPPKAALRLFHALSYALWLGTRTTPPKLRDGSWFTPQRRAVCEASIEYLRRYPGELAAGG